MHMGHSYGGDNVRKGTAPEKNRASGRGEEKEESKVTSDKLAE